MKYILESRVAKVLIKEWQSGWIVKLILPMKYKLMRKERVIKVPIESIVQESGDSFVWLCNQNSEGKFIVSKRIITPNRN